MNSQYRIAIIGSGGFGREVYELLKSHTYNIVGFIDVENSKANLPCDIIGHESDMAILINKHALSHCVIAIGDKDKRMDVYKHIKDCNIQFPIIRDISVRSYAQDIEQGVILYPNVVVMNDCRIGCFSMLNSGVTLGHDVVIGEFCNINPGAHLAGNIVVGDGAFIGMGASIRENITIGAHSIIGAGSVVLNDVPDRATVYGVPAN